MTDKRKIEFILNNPLAILAFGLISPIMLVCFITLVVFVGFILIGAGLVFCLVIAIVSSYYFVKKALSKINKAYS